MVAAIAASLAGLFLSLGYLILRLSGSPGKEDATGATRLYRYGGDYYVEAEFKVLGWSKWRPIEYRTYDNLENRVEALRHKDRPKDGTSFDEVAEAKKVAREYREQLRRKREKHASDGPVGCVTTSLHQGWL